MNDKVDFAKVKIIIWDWFRTLSGRHLYEDLEKDYPGAYEIVQNYFLNNKESIAKWSTGSISYNEIHQEFAELTGLPKSTFDSILGTLAGKFDIDKKILPYIEKFKERGFRQVIATDNFDVWDEFFLPQYSSYLNVYFEANYNSARFRILKNTHAQEFIQKILEESGLDAKDALLIDDNKDFTDAFVKMGGQAINHENISDLSRKLAELE